MPGTKSQFRRNIFKELLILLESIFVNFYFAYWSYKTLARTIFKYGSLAVVSLSTTLLTAEVLAESFGSKRVQQFVEYLSHNPIVRWVSIGVFVLAVGYLAVHHYKEAKKPNYEYTFVKRLCDFLEGSRGNRNEPARIKGALEIFHSVFRRAGVTHVSIHRLNGNILEINPDDVFPPETNASFFVPLATGEGVAGLVYEDLKPRYVPRVFIPDMRKRWPQRMRLFFPHAVKMAFEEEAIVGQFFKPLEIVDSDLDRKVFKLREKSIPFRSFLSVPLKCSGEHSCFGILNFDFIRADPLDKADIAMAVIFGRLLGDEMAPSIPRAE